MLNKKLSDLFLDLHLSLVDDSRYLILIISALKIILGNVMKGALSLKIYLVGVCTFAKEVRNKVIRLIVKNE